jgi:NTE family protein
MKTLRKRVGLVLGSGAAKGISYIGVIKVLEQANIPIDFICGSSVGALIGGLYASTKDIKRIEEIALNTDWKTLLALVDFAMPTKGLINGGKIEKFLAPFLDKKTFKEMLIPINIISTDIISGHEKVFSSGYILPAIRASISIPYVMKSYAYNESFYVDGGMSNPLPVNQAKNMGANFIISVSTFGDILNNSTKKTNNNHPNLFDITFQAISVMQRSLAKTQLEFSDIKIAPNVYKYSWRDFYKAKELIAEGEIAARSVLPEILDKIRST